AVDEFGRVIEFEDVFAAGDVARFPAKALGTLVRVEHEDHANSHGRAVGANMAGANTPYTNLPFFYSDLFELGYEAVGDVDSRLETQAAWAEPNRKGVVSATGRTLYHYTDETKGKVDCAGACVKLWPPLVVKSGAKPVAGPGITASKLGVMKRPDGTFQVTYGGLGLYTYAGDKKAG